MVIAQKYGERLKGIGISEKDFHIIEYDEDWFLLHIPTLKFFEIDRLAYEWIRAVFSKKPSSLKDLFRRWGGKKVKEVEKEFIAHTLRPGTVLKKKKGIEVRKIYLNVAQACNLKCSYCYGKDGSYGSDKPFMDEETALETVDYFAQKLKKGSDFEIRFFGGEPLLNFGLIKKIVRHAEKIRKKKAITFRYSVSTNGTLFEKRIVRFLKANRFDIAVSIDGPSRFLNRFRKYRSGKNSLSDVLKGVNLLRRYGKGLRVKALVAVNKDLDFPKTFRWLIKAGFDEVTFKPLALKAALSWQILETGLTRLFKDVSKDLGKGILVPSSLGNFASYLRRLESADKAYRPCEVLRSSLAVDTEGGFWFCHRFNNRKGFRIGSCKEGLKTILEIPDVDELNMCSECFAKYLCAGGCYYHNLLETGNIFKPHGAYCRFMKNLIEMVIMMYIGIKRRGTSLNQLNSIKGIIR